METFTSEIRRVGQTEIMETGTVSALERNYQLCCDYLYRGNTLCKYFDDRVSDVAKREIEVEQS